MLTAIPCFLPFPFCQLPCETANNFKQLNCFTCVSFEGFGEIGYNLVCVFTGDVQFSQPDCIFSGTVICINPTAIL